MMIDGWVIAKNKARQFVHGRLMVDDFSAKEFHKFVARVNRPKGNGNLTKFLTLLPLN